MTKFDEKILTAKNCNTLNIISKLGLTQKEEDDFASKFGRNYFLIFPAEKSIDTLFEEVEIIPLTQFQLSQGINSFDLEMAYFNETSAVWMVNVLC